jgi:hypothetical protein
MREAVAALLLLLLWTAGSALAQSPYENATCTVGPFGMFSTLQAALDGCRPITAVPNATQVDVFLTLDGSFSECLVFPSDVSAVTMTGALPGDPASATISCLGGHTIDPMVIGQINVTFASLTLDLAGSTGPGLFSLPVGNANLTISGTRIENYAGTPGQALLQQTACEDTSTLVFDSNDCTGIAGELIYVLGMHSVFINNNNFSRAGIAAENFIVVDQNEVSQGVIDMENNTQ